MQSRWIRFFAVVGLLAAVGCLFVALGAGLGYRFGWWHFRAGIATLGIVFWVAAGTTLVCALSAVLALLRAGWGTTLVMSLAGVLRCCDRVGPLQPARDRHFSAAHSRHHDRSARSSAVENTGGLMEQVTPPRKRGE